MKTATRTLAAALIIALGLAACGGGTPTSGPATQAPDGTVGPGATGTTATPAVGANIQGLGTELLAPIFGSAIPTPTCDDLAGGGYSCRWMTGDGELLLDADADPTFASEAEWRDQFGTAGFDQEIPGIGVAALGGDNPLSDGWRASAYTADGIAYTVTVNKPGDPAAVQAAVIAILTALVS